MTSPDGAGIPDKGDVGGWSGDYGPLSILGAFGQALVQGITAGLQVDLAAQQATVNDHSQSITELRAVLNQLILQGNALVTKLYREHAGGCDECNGIGYTGRRGIYEVLANTNELQKLIVANGTSNDIQTKAIDEGMITMQLDGLIKAFRGVTSIEEILRVTRE